MIAETDINLLWISSKDFNYVFGKSNELIETMLQLAESRLTKALHIIDENSVFREFSNSQKT